MAFANYPEQDHHACVLGTKLALKARDYLNHGTDSVNDPTSSTYSQS